MVDIHPGTGPFTVFRENCLTPVAKIVIFSSYKWKGLHGSEKDPKSDQKYLQSFDVKMLTFETFSSNPVLNPSRYFLYLTYFVMNVLSKLFSVTRELIYVHAVMYYSVPLNQFSRYM